MGAFLLHRLPNTGEDRTELFLDNARRLGLAMPNAVTSSSSEDYKECEETTASPSPLSGVLGAEGAEGRNLDAYSAFYNSVSLPPLPFLPAPNYVPTHPYSGKMSVEKDKGKNNNNGD